jgi:hypothetical protein
MKKSCFFTRMLIYFLFIAIVLPGTLSAKITETFRNFLYSNAELVSRLAHPTNEYIDAYVDSADKLVIISKSIFTDSRQELKIYISEDFKTFEVISDDSFVPAFTAIELIKDLLIDIIKDIKAESSDSGEENKLIQAVLDKIDDLDGKQLSYVILFLRWMDYYTD